MPEPPDPDDWILRVDALALTRVAIDCGEGEASKYLTNHICDQPSFTWRCRPWYRVELAAADDRPRRPRRLPDRTEINIGIQTWFWRYARKYEAHVWLEGNSASYYGPAFLAPVHAEARYSGFTLSTKENVILVNPDWLLTLYLSAIRIHVLPLVAALRSDGGLVDAAIKHLQARERLPAALLTTVDPPASLAPGPAPKPNSKWIEAMLVSRRPLPDESMKAWSERVSPEHSGRVRNFLSQNNDLWVRYGGKLRGSP